MLKKRVRNLIFLPSFSLLIYFTNFHVNSSFSLIFTLISLFHQIHSKNKYDGGKLSKVMDKISVTGQANDEES